MKDNFSKHSDLYVRFRPTYPKEMYNFIYRFVDEFKYAWDCATGNGQVAVELSGEFKNVIGTDISKNQISLAPRSENVKYIVDNAEQTSFKNELFNLIIVAQAIHWFDFHRFYDEVNRVLKSNGAVAAISYHLIRCDKEIDSIIDFFYYEVTGPYWDKERKYIDEYYKTIPFPFKEVKTPVFNSEFNWSLEHLTGFLKSWSAVQHYIEKHNINPVDELLIELRKAWGNNLKRKVRFPVFMRLGIKI